MTEPVFSAPTDYLNALEPPGLVRHFLAHPPVGFVATLAAQGMPGFLADFDLLTTAEPAVLRRFEALPGSRWLRRFLRWPTRFFGTTVSEYALMPPTSVAAQLPAALLEAWENSTRLLIVKDIPDASPLLTEAERAYALAFAAACEARGFVMVEGQALAYVPIDFADQAAYLARLSSGRRKDIRRKLKAAAQLRVEVLATGCPELREPDFLDELYALYLEVYAQSELHFDCLSAEFFRAVFQDASLSGILFLYRSEEQLIGFNLCFVHAGMLVDKYVGFRYPAAREHNLYFLSWMENLAFARREGLSHYIAGWTDPQIKAYLGACFTFTRHAVYVRNPLLRALLKKMSRHFESDRAWFSAHAAASAARS